MVLADELESPSVDFQSTALPSKLDEDDGTPRSIRNFVPGFVGQNSIR